MPNSKRILSLDPGNQKLGFAVFDERDLVDYGVKNIPRVPNFAEFLGRLEVIFSGLVEDFKPTAIVLARNSTAFSNIQPWRKSALQKIRKEAKNLNIPVKEYGQRYVRKAVCGKSRASRRELSEAVIEQFPELDLYQEPKFVWKERHYQHLFNAVAAGFAYLQDNPNNERNP